VGERREEKVRGRTMRERLMREKRGVPRRVLPLEESTHIHGPVDDDDLLPVPPNSTHLPHVVNPSLLCSGASFSGRIGWQGV
jgi:hypothetical protein